jgi:hypothetical protein
MKNLNKTTHKFLINDDGIDILFRVFSQALASTIVLKFSLFLLHRNILAFLTTLFIAAIFSFFAIYNGVHKFWFPFLKAIYGKNERLTEFEETGRIRLLFKLQILIGLIGILLLMIVFFFCLEVIQSELFFR